MIGNLLRMLAAALLFSGAAAAQDLPTVKSGGRPVASTPTTEVSPFGTAWAIPTDAAVLSALYAGRAFIGTTGLVEVSNTQSLAVTLENPASSGRDVVLTHLRFSIANPGAPLAYTVYHQPTFVPTEGGIETSLRIGAVAGQATVLYQAVEAASLVMGGTEATSNFVVQDIPIPYIIPPGTVLGLRIDGPAKNGSGTQQFTGVSLVWYEHNS